MSYTYPFITADEELKQAVWNKGKIIPGYIGSEWRKDIYGGTMQYSQHGNTSSHNGWEIDHIKPIAKGGMDDLSNLQPLYWENNRKKADIY